MIFIATPLSTLLTSLNKIKKILKFSDLLEGRENIQTIKNSGIRIIHFDLDIHKKFKVKDKNHILKIINDKKLDLISFQLTSDFYNPKLLGNKFYPKGKKISKINIYKNITFNINWLYKNINIKCKIAIENNNYYNTGAYNNVTNLKFVNNLLKKFNLFFLFDYSHAKVSAFNLNKNFDKYISDISNENVIQVHFCGYSINDNEAIDTHSLPNKIDYFELKKLLSKFNKLSYITLEYYKDIDNLTKSLKVIKKIIS